MTAQPLTDDEIAATLWDEPSLIDSVRRDEGVAIFRAGMLKAAEIADASEVRSESPHASYYIRLAAGESK